MSESKKNLNMEITKIDREKLPGCCQYRQDGYKELQKEENLTPKGNLSMRAITSEMYNKFQALVIGNVLIENMGRKTCLNCLHFRHKGLEYYAEFKKGGEGKRLKEQYDKR